MRQTQVSLRVCIKFAKFICKLDVPPLLADVTNKSSILSVAVHVFGLLVFSEWVLNELPMEIVLRTK